MLLVPRTCVRQYDTEDERVAEPTPLNDTQALTAYVLLGDPGLGKSAAFRQEADAVGGHRISAGDFLALATWQTRRVAVSKRTYVLAM